MRTTWFSGRYTSTMRSLPKPQLAASPSLRHLQHHLHRLLSTSRGTTPGENQLNLLNQPPLPRGPLNQPPLPQSLPSQPLHLSQPRLPRVGPPRAPQPMRIRGWAHLCDALRGSRQPPKPLLLIQHTPSTWQGHTLTPCPTTPAWEKPQTLSASPACI